MSQETHGSMPLIAMSGGNTKHMLFDAEDEQETNDLAGSARETHYADLLRHALETVEAPSEQFERLGLA